MRKSKTLRTFTAGVLAALAALTPIAGVQATGVQPVVIDLQTSGRQMSQVITVQNTFQTPLPVELRVQEAEYTVDGLRGTGEETEDLLIFPPQALIAPGRTQSFRVQYVGDPQLQRSKHYYVTVAQLPVQLPEGQSAVQILYNFQVVVGVSVPGVRPELSIARTEISTEGDGQPRVVLFIQNDTTTYGYLSSGSLRITHRNETGQEIFTRSFTSEEISQQIGFGLVGGGQTRRILTPIVLPQAGGTVEAQFTPGR